MKLSLFLFALALVAWLAADQGPTWIEGSVLEAASSRPPGSVSGSFAPAPAKAAAPAPNQASRQTGTPLRTGSTAQPAMPSVPAGPGYSSAGAPFRLRSVRALPPTPWATPTLIGIAGSGEGAFALFRDDASKEVRKAATGDQLGPWNIKALSGDCALLRRGRSERRLCVDG